MTLEMKMKLILNRSRSGTLNSARSVCGRYAWQCRTLSIIGKQKAMKATGIVAQDVRR